MRASELEEVRFVIIKFVLVSKKEITKISCVFSVFPHLTKPKGNYYEQSKEEQQNAIVPFTRKYKRDHVE